MDKNWKKFFEAKTLFNKFQNLGKVKLIFKSSSGKTIAKVKIDKTDYLFLHSAAKALDMTDEEFIRNSILEYIFKYNNR